MSKLEAVHSSIIFLFKSKSSEASKFGLDILHHHYNYNMLFRALNNPVSFPSIEFKVHYFSDLLFFIGVISSKNYDFALDRKFIDFKFFIDHKEKLKE